MPKEVLTITGDAVEREGEWFVLHSRSRQEKRLAEDLQALNVAYFLPLVDTVRIYGRRKQAVQLPLFTGYVFVRGTIEEAYRADQTRRVANIIRVQNQELIQQELTAIHQVIAAGGVLDPCPYLKRGMRVTVTAGPFKGTEGVIEDDRRRSRLVLQITTLGQASSLEIDSGLLAPVENEPLALAG